MNQHVAFDQLQPQPPLRASDEIMGGQRKIQIAHEGSIYTLQVTRQGKLLLTK